MCLSYSNLYSGILYEREWKDPKGRKRIDNTDNAMAKKQTMSKKQTKQ